MRVVNGTLLICNDNKVGMVGWDGSYTKEAVRLLPTEISKTLLERDGNAIIATQRKDALERGSLYSWQEESLNYDIVKSIPAKGINAIVDAELPIMQAGTDGGIYYSNMVSVLPLKTFPGTGGQVNPDGVDVDDGLMLMGMYGNSYSGIYTLGRKMLNGSFILNNDYPITCDEIGALKNIGTDLLVSYKVGSSYYVRKVDSAAKATAYYYSIDLKAPTGLQDKPTWEFIKLYTKDMPANTTIEAYFRLDKTGNFVQAKMNEGTTAMTSGTEGIFFIGEQGNIAEIQLKLTPYQNTTPEVYKIEPYFR